MSMVGTRGLSYADMQSLLERFSYRPGWIFTLYLDDNEGVKLEIFMRVLCAYSGEERVQSVKTYVPPCHSEKDFWTYLLWRLERVESHELREFFRVGGVPIFNPHED